MRDVELVVRCFAFNTYLTDYRGNLKKFLDDTCDNLNKRWPVEEQKLRGIAAQMEEAIQAAVTIFTHDFVFKKWDGKKYEKSLNRAVFDVIASSLIDPKVRAAATKDKLKVRQAFKDVCINQEFRSAVESTTKSKTAVRNRFSLWFHALGSVIGKKIPLTLPPE
jgi:hypothetical protein